MSTAEEGATRTATVQGRPVEEIIPLVEETVRIGKRRVETGRLRVSITTKAAEETVRTALRTRRAEVERLAIGREVAEAPPTREEDGVLVIPVVEEILVVEKRLILREEIRLRFVDGEETVEQPVVRRVQRATVERLPPGPGSPPGAVEWPGPIPGQTTDHTTHRIVGHSASNTEETAR